MLSISTNRYAILRLPDTGNTSKSYVSDSPHRPDHRDPLFAAQHLELMEASYKKQEYLGLVVICNWLKSETQSGL
jgi:hypothetical protein